MLLQAGVPGPTPHDHSRHVLIIESLDRFSHRFETYGSHSSEPTHACRLLTDEISVVIDMILLVIAEAFAHAQEITSPLCPTTHSTQSGISG
jgi:hypothetical protein